MTIKRRRINLTDRIIDEAGRPTTPFLRDLNDTLGHVAALRTNVADLLAAAYIEGTGIDIDGDTIAVDASVVAFLNSPAFTGNPSAPTQGAGNSSTRLASTAFVQGELTTGLATKAAVSHTHNASDLTSGTIDVARLPVLPGNNQVVATTTIAGLDSGQQASIALGTIVTTSDGRRWVYNTGTKTSESSYIELADVTPEWTAVANRPSFATVATSGSYSDLTGKPTLGTIASQNANSVTITGGSIDSITLDGGTF